MKTIEEKIAVMQAFKDGKEIEVYHIAKKGWFETNDPAWDWSITDYRVKEEPKEPQYVPFTFEDAEFLIGKLVKSKNKNWIEMIIWCSNAGTSADDYEDLLSDNTFLDGSPCGKLKQ